MAASFSPSFTTMTGVPSVSALPEQRFAERGEDTVRQGAVIRGSRVRVDIHGRSASHLGRCHITTTR